MPVISVCLMLIWKVIWMIPVKEESTGKKYTQFCAICVSILPLEVCTLLLLLSLCCCCVLLLLIIIINSWLWAGKRLNVRLMGREIISSKQG